MAITNGYCTLIDIKASLGITDTTDDAALETAVEAASRWIDYYCGRRFHTTTSDETRYYTAEYPDVLYLPDDLISVTALATDDDRDGTWDTIWATSDFALQPSNAPLNGCPYTTIRVTPAGAYGFPRRVPDGVQVLGKFGFAAIPAAVRQACLIQATRIYKRRDAPFGVTGSAEMGTLQILGRIDPDVASLLSGLMRMV